MDFSGIFARERELFPTEPADRVQWKIMDFRDLDGTMCFCSEESAREIRRQVFAAEESFGKIHWIDTGDYHYLSYFFLERMAEPFTLVLLDHHPDDQPSVFGGDVLSCGGWVLWAKERLSRLRRVVSVGPEGNVTVRERMSGSAGEWREVRKAGMESAAAILREMIPEDECVYLSIDKDVLSKEFARTDWSQGSMELPEMLLLLDILRSRKVTGADLCGGLSEAKGAVEADFEVNARTDWILIDKLLDIIN